MPDGALETCLAGMGSCHEPSLAVPMGEPGAMITNNSQRASLWVPSCSKRLIRSIVSCPRHKFRWWVLFISNIVEMIK